MSDTPQGPGWWQASDGRFYPPEEQADFATYRARAQRRKVAAWLGVGLALLVMVVGVFALAATPRAPEMPDGLSWRYNGGGDIVVDVTNLDPDTLLQAGEAVRGEAEVGDSMWVLFRCPSTAPDGRDASYRWAETQLGTAQIGVDEPGDHIFEVNDPEAC